MTRNSAAIVADQATFHQILGLIQTLMVSKVPRPTPQVPGSRVQGALPPCVPGVLRAWSCVVVRAAASTRARCLVALHWVASCTEETRPPPVD